MLLKQNLIIQLNKEYSLKDLLLVNRKSSLETLLSNTSFDKVEIKNLQMQALFQSDEEVMSSSYAS